MTLSASQTRVCVQFDVTDDVEVDPNEVFNVALTTSSPYATTRVGRDEAVVTIDDNDQRELYSYHTNRRVHLLTLHCSGWRCLPASHLQRERGCWNC